MQKEATLRATKVCQVAREQAVAVGGLPAFRL
jgi:hypothetical protein